MKTNTLFVGVGNPSPQMDDLTRPGDNLYTNSIDAVDLNSGAYKWHYQMVPNEQWDFTCTQPIVLADMKIDGKQIHLG